MKHYIYPENKYRYERASGGRALEVEHFPDDDTILAMITSISGGMTIRLTTEAAAMLAGFILSKQPAIVKGDAMAFSSATRACDAIPEPDFTVIGQGELAPTEEPDTKDDDQDVKVTVTSPDPESAKRAGKAFAAHLSNKWVAKDASLPHTTHPSPVITEAQHEELRRLQAADAPEDLGLLHPDQERRLTALREANDILGGRLTHDRLLECAGWILDGNIGKED